MSADSFTEVTSQSWGSRIGGSFKGIIVGLIIFLVGFPVLFWNEGRAVKRHKTLQEGGSAVVSVSSDSLDPANEGLLVHTTGTASTEEILTDGEFGVSAPAIKLRRNVAMYQWQENSESETRKKLGGGTETTTTYTYKKVWNDDLISSGSFKEASGHQNPASMPYSSQSMTASRVTLGAYELPPSLVGKIGNFSALQVVTEDPVPAALGEKAKYHAGGFYIGASAGSPEIGDLQVSFEVAKPGIVSTVARQIGNTLEPYNAKAGGTIELLQIGTHSAESMFQAAERQNTITTWIFRVVGFFLMYIGLGMIFKPLSVLADVVPFIGSLVGMGTGLLAFLLAALFAFVTAGIAWIVYRPLLGIVLIAVGVAMVLGIKVLARGKGAPPPPPEPAAGA